MESKNSFYIAKSNERVQMLVGYSWASGSLEPVDNYKMASSDLIDIRDISRFAGVDPINVYSVVKVCAFDENKKLLVPPFQVSTRYGYFSFKASGDAKYIALEVYTNDIFANVDYEIVKMYEIIPYYKTLSKQYKKEDGQFFFRESINGKINLHGFGYNFVKNASLEDTLALYIYRDDTQIAVNEFNKTDCKFDHHKGSVELKLTPKDKYINILNNYDKTHDLIKLAVAKEFITLTKRCIIQVYIQGEKTVTNYAGGTYWEEEVIESVDNSNLLQTKYYFAKGPVFKEISLNNFNYDNLNSVFKCIEGASVWNSRSAPGSKPSSIKFVKKYSAGETIGPTVPTLYPCKLMSDGTSDGYRNGIVPSTGGYGMYAVYDCYKIELYSGPNGTGSKLYESKYLYGNDSNFILASGSNLFEMNSLTQASPNKQPTPATFYLGAHVIEYQIWGRLLCDVDKDTEGGTLYDLPYDDFITERSNFKKCIGLTFTQNEKSLVRIMQSNLTSEYPTPYGLTEYGEYFAKPQFINNQFNPLFAYPLAKSTWGNTSLWIAFEEDSYVKDFSLEKWSKRYYKEIQHKDCMEIGAVIKALLKEIDSNISFESTPAYSEFLYGDTPYGYNSRGLRIYITQKSNVLKGEYDQAAQKAEITFKQLMEMLRDCFRCYWYIDSDNRLRVEHIRYFMNGLSYSSPEIQLDLTQKHDKFNRKVTLYDQQKISYSKSDLNSRYEFSWADDATSESMGGNFSADIKSKYVQRDKKETINIDSFTSDIDMMMFAPDKFSEDGFALIIAKDNKVPIVNDEIYDQQDSRYPKIIYTQNYYASFIDLFNNYMYDMPSNNFSTSVDRNQNNSERYNAYSLKRFTEHEVEFISNFDIDVYKLIKTEIGNGYIEEASIDIDTVKVKTTLTY